VVVAINKSTPTKKGKSNAGNFEHHEDTAVQCGVDCPMDHIRGFTRSHWLPTFGECLSHIVLAAAMVNKFVAKHKTLPNTTFSANLR